MTYSPTLSGNVRGRRSVSPVDQGKPNSGPSEKATGFARFVLRAGSSISGLFVAALRASQYGQMTRVLNSMPDESLRQIGITRAEIPTYARSLIDDDLG